MKNINTKDLLSTIQYTNRADYSALPYNNDFKLNWNNDINLNLDYIFNECDIVERLGEEIELDNNYLCLSIENVELLDKILDKMIN